MHGHGLHPGGIHATDSVRFVARQLALLVDITNNFSLLDDSLTHHFNTSDRK